MITSDPVTASYSDPYASNVEGLGSLFGNCSIVIHYYMAIPTSLVAPILCPCSNPPSLRHIGPGRGIVDEIWKWHCSTVDFSAAKRE